MESTAGPESFSMGKVRSQRVLISSRCETQDRGTALPCGVLAVHNRVLLKNLFFLSVHFKGLGFCRLWAPLPLPWRGLDCYQLEPEDTFCREQSLFPFNCFHYALKEHDSQKQEKFGHNGNKHPLKTVLQHPQSCCRDKPIKIVLLHCKKHQQQWKR